MARILTFNELQALARANYAQGGDRVVECWDENDFNRYVEVCGPITYREAMKLFKLWKSQEDEFSMMAVGEVY